MAAVNQLNETGGAKGEAELLAAARLGDRHAFETLVRAYVEHVYRLAFGMTRNQGDAEAVVQETFTRIWKALPAYRGTQPFDEWVYTAASNAALMCLRNQKHRAALSLTEPPPVIGHGAKPARWEPSPKWRKPEEELASPELAQALDGWVMAMPEKYRMLLLLCDVEGLSHQDVASALGLTLPNVRSRLHRARLLVREALDDYYEGRKAQPK